MRRALVLLLAVGISTAAGCHTQRGGITPTVLLALADSLRADAHRSACVLPDSLLPLPQRFVVLPCGFQSRIMSDLSSKKCRFHTTRELPVVQTMGLAIGWGVGCVT